MSKMKKSFLAILALAAFSALTLGIYFYKTPLEAYQNVEFARMGFMGISNTQQKEFNYFEKNNCVDGEPCQCVLLIHGLGDFAFTWIKLMSLDPSEFATKTHFFAPNLPGALGTPKLAEVEDYNVQNISKLVSDFFLNRCESWVLVGNSYGGWIAALTAGSNEKVKGLVLLGPAGIKADYSHIVGYFLNPTVEGAKDFYKKTYYNTKDLSDFIFIKIVERLKTQPVLEQLKSVKDKDYLDYHLKDLKIPVEFVWGESDQVIPVQWAEEYRKITPNSNLKIIPKCGHVPQKECLPEVLTAFNELLNKMKTN